MQHGRYIKLRKDQLDHLLSQDLDGRVATLQGYAAEDALRVREDVEETRASEVRLELSFGSSSRDGNSLTRLNISRELDDAAHFGDYSDTSTLCDFLAKCGCESPVQPLQSISWTINSTDQRDALSMPFLDYVTEVVTSNGYQSEGDIELSFQPTSASVHGFDAFNLKLTQYVRIPSGDANDG